MRPSARCLGDQLLAILHDHLDPMSTADLAASAPARMEIYVGCEAHWHSHVRSARTQREICYGDHHIHVRAYYAREVYETLRTLASEGEVTRLRAHGDPTVYWQAVTAARFVDELEACLALHPAPRDR